MDNRNLKNKKTPLVEIYDDILKFYFAQGYLKIATPVAKHIFTGKNWKAKLINYSTPFFKFIKRYFEYKKRFQPHFTKKNLEGKTWLFINSLNNRNSLLFLKDGLSDSILVGNGISIEPEDKFQIPFHHAFLYIWKYPKIWLFFYKQYKKMAINYGDFLFKSVGLYEVAFKVLSKYRPKCIILSNDHSEKQRALLNAAKRLGIPTIYLQHASISHFMPPLDFELSLLEGQGALDKYKSLGVINGEVKLIGMPKFDNYIHLRNYSKTVNTIGICTNILDRPKEIYSLIEAIQKRFPHIEISVRPHPGYKIDLKPPKNVRLSTKEEFIFDFLKKQDLLIAGSSSVHLEAILLNVTSLYYQISPVNNNARDPYSYIENNLLPEAISITELLEMIQKNIEYRNPVFQNTKHYHHLIGTKDEAQSSLVTIKYIEAFLQNESHKL